MACAYNGRRQLLLSIIRGPTLSSHYLSATSSRQTRSICSTDARRSGEFSITFGSEIDSLLNPSKKLPKSKRNQPGSRSQELKEKPVKSDTNLKIHGVSNRPSYTSVDNKNHTAAGLSSTNDGFQHPIIGSQPALASASLQERPVNDHQSTIELSGDAYDTISRPSDTKDVSPNHHSRRNRNNTVGADTRKLSESPRETSRRAGKDVATSNLQSAQGTIPAMKPRIRSEPWQVQKDALKKKFGEQAWNPRKKISPDAMDGIRALHEQDTERYSTEVLAQQFKLSPEAIRRILKSKWRPSSEQMEDRRQRWARRHDRIWDQKAALGLRPSRTKLKQPDSQEAFEEQVAAKQLLGQL